VKPFVDGRFLGGGAGSQSFVDDLHADGVRFAPGGFLVGVDPSHDHGVFFGFGHVESFHSNFGADFVGSAFFTGDHEVVADSLGSSFSPVESFGSISFSSRGSGSEASFSFSSLSFDIGPEAKFLKE